MAGRRAGTQPWRRLFHAVNGVLLGTAIHYLPLASLTVAAILGGAFSVLLLADVVRLTQPRANELFFRVFGPLASPREARGLASSTWYTLGVALAVALFPRGAAVSAVFVLGLCDPGASYVGRRWGRRPLLGGDAGGERGIRVRRRPGPRPTTPSPRGASGGAHRRTGRASVLAAGRQLHHPHRVRGRADESGCVVMSQGRTVSVVVPTLNEERFLPTLLASLARQTIPVHEVIVADAGSSDRTVELARAAGARVVPGGHPGVGRNAGATGATGSHLLFLDADVRLPEGALEDAFTEMGSQRLESASCWFVPDSTDPSLRLTHWFSCHYFGLTSRLGWPHSIGAFLLLPRAVHVAIGGFDTSVKVAEDQDYVRRLARHGRYGFIRRPVVEIAARRFESEGSLRMNVKWIAIELHRLILGEIRGDYFRYFK
ncbi:MAG TPA: glycosyltransferase [bacterium]